ncbi:TetR family transcriptional regulator [Gluconacetobacter johannae DSM 13595]|uniref:TetR family transcriptional regulator n=1 Tax=Gluconacetobacter johannae TaxID=112140 RepID=A0A7W4P232_9PROT|nr:TetR/AcrR family transcriptional regulator [Gluconacetobacter johannae]MBB2174597.1 TetR family transcriptional regulator [Gluconacetobacter johannae]GBQ84284.1 TetR family transcriptional regulator [Gluconacetobacter johannae DSM 13595]
MSNTRLLPSQSASSPPPQDKPAGAPRRASMQQIFRAAEHLFGRDGYKGTSMAAIAAGAGLPKANIHYYFGTKEDLYRAVLENILVDWLDDATLWIREDLTPREGLEGYIRAKIAFSRDRPDASRIFAHEVLQGAPHINQFLGTSLRIHVQNLDKIFTAWQRAGLMRPIPTTHLMFCIWSMTQTYADMNAQIVAVLGTPTLETQDYEDAAATITALVLGGCQLPAH